MPIHIGQEGEGPHPFSAMLGVRVAPKCQRKAKRHCLIVVPASLEVDKLAKIRVENDTVEIQLVGLGRLELVLEARVA